MMDSITLHTTEIKATGLQYSYVKREPKPLNIGHT